MKKLTPFLYALPAPVAAGPFCADAPQAVAQPQRSLPSPRRMLRAGRRYRRFHWPASSADPRLERFFVGTTKEGISRIRQYVIDFLGNLLPGPAPTGYEKSEVVGAVWGAITGLKATIIGQ